MKETSASAILFPWMRSEEAFYVPVCCIVCRGVVDDQADDTMVLKMLPEQLRSLLRMMRLLSPARRSTLMAVPSPHWFVVEND